MRLVTGSYIRRLYVNGNRARMVTRLGRITRWRGTGRVRCARLCHPGVCSPAQGAGEQREGEEIGAYISRARTALYVHTERKSERERDRENKRERRGAGGREADRGERGTHRYTLYILSLDARTQSARIRRWARRWRRARWDRRFPLWWGTTRVVCVYTVPARRATR